jgi:hypothetical protein
MSEGRSSSNVSRLGSRGPSIRLNRNESSKSIKGGNFKAREDRRKPHAAIPHSRRHELVSKPIVSQNDLKVK